MTDEEAEAALFALGSQLEWVSGTVLISYFWLGLKGCTTACGTHPGEQRIDTELQEKVRGETDSM